MEKGPPHPTGHTARRYAQNQTLTRYDCLPPRQVREPVAVLDELHQNASGDILPFSQSVEANEPETPDELPPTFGRLYEYGPILRQPRTNRINGPI